MMSPREARIVEALSRAVMPPIEGWDDAGGVATAARLSRWLESAPEVQRKAISGLLWTAELAPLLTTGKPLSKLPPHRASTYLERWRKRDTQAFRQLLRAILTPVKQAHFWEREKFETPPKHSLDQALTKENRHLARVTRGDGIPGDVELECEVVVVGTGAGGAACAYELASRGRAVLILEEGAYHDRRTFVPNPTVMARRLYRNSGMTMAIGNVPIPVWAGRAVGGSTIINSGTCLRPETRVFERWTSELGLTGFDDESLSPYYARAEAMLGVEDAKEEYLGNVARVVARGADALGWSHKPLRRNAPDCDGKGLCCFGCPTGAKRSTDVSYVPAALLSGAELYTHARVTNVIVENGRAVGVRAKLDGGGTLTVRAQAVVLACGALYTPVFLKHTLGEAFKKTTALGQNLSLHPCSKVMGVMEETVDMRSGIPQGYTIDTFAKEGILLEGASMPPDVTALSIPFVGEAFSRAMRDYIHLATFGFMIEDDSRGHVRAGPRGESLVFYNLSPSDVARMHRAIVLLTELFLAAHAKRVIVGIHGVDEVEDMRGLEALRALKPHAGAFEVTAYHPLGTCRIGSSPETSVCKPNHETHAIPGLYVADGSSVPTALGVNPQLTIMALAHKAAEGIDKSLG